MHPDVSVVVMTRNRRGSLLRTLEHLRELPESPEVIVVDNASQDGTVEHVRERFPDVLVVPLPVNIGVSARNVGALLSRGRFVAFSDDDSWWASGSLADAAQVLDDHPWVGLLAARALVGPEGRPDAIDVQLRNSPLGTAPGDPGPSVLGFLAFACVVRREAFLAVGGFSSLLFFHGEERLLALDLWADRWSVCFVDRLVTHHHPPAFEAGREGRDALGVRNELLTIWLRRRLRAVVPASARVLLRRRPCVSVRGLTGASCRLPEAARRRAVLPRSVDDMVAAVDRAASHR